MLLSIRLVPFIGLALVLSALPVCAAEGGDSEAAALSADAIAALIKQLGVGEFSEREAASRKLAEAGKAAIPALAEAAASDNREVSTRSIHILQKLLTSSDEETKAAAREVLKEIAAVPAEAIAALVKQLDAGEISEREAASRKLAEAGKAAIPALAEAAASDNREVSTRSIRILHELFMSSDERTKAAAGVVLEEIAKSKRPSGEPRAKVAIPQPAGFEVVQRQRRLMRGGVNADPAKSIEDATKQLRRVGEQLDEALEDAEGTTELHKALKDFQEELKRQLAVVEKQLKK